MVLCGKSIEHTIGRVGIIQIRCNPTMPDAFLPECRLIVLPDQIWVNDRYFRLFGTVRDELTPLRTTP